MRRMFSLDQLKPDTTKPWKWLSNAMLKFRRSRAPLAKRPSITKTKVRSTSKEPIPEPRPAPQIDDQSQVGQRSTSLQFLEQSIPVQVEKPPVKVEVTKLIGPRSSSVSLLLEPTAVDQQFIDRHLERVNTKRSSLGRTGSMRDPVRPLAMDPRKLSIRRTKKVDDKVEPTIVMGTFDGVPVPFQGSLLDLVEFAINEPCIDVDDSVFVCPSAALDLSPLCHFVPTHSYCAQAVRQAFHDYNGS
ncbi:hypothetical protein EDD86DRAFT_220722 [Gorgonomyces haynaldii]|nr:hypothetical protein EDD86DRAFT_220722 [Gorgonomyces haynaldii]